MSSSVMSRHDKDGDVGQDVGVGRGLPVATPQLQQQADERGGPLFLAASTPGLLVRPAVRKDIPGQLVKVVERLECAPPPRKERAEPLSPKLETPPDKFLQDGSDGVDDGDPATASLPRHAAKKVTSESHLAYDVDRQANHEIVDVNKGLGAHGIEVVDHLVSRLDKGRHHVAHRLGREGGPEGLEMQREEKRKFKRYAGHCHAQSR